jgi:hypothetical protein
MVLVTTAQVRLNDDYLLWVDGECQSLEGDPVAWVCVIDAKRNRAELAEWTRPGHRFSVNDLKHSVADALRIVAGKEPLDARWSVSSRLKGGAG